MILDFSELENRFFSVSDAFASRQIFNGKTEFVMHEPRPTDAFLLFANTTGVCYQKGEEPLYIPHGALVYMPKNCSYMWENSPAVGSVAQENLLFEFTLNDIPVTRGELPKRQMSCKFDIGDGISFSDRVVIVTTHGTEIYKNLLYTIIGVLGSGGNAVLSAYSAIYNFFNTLSVNCKAERSGFTSLKVVETGMKYLENSSENRTIGEISNLCGVSMGYFERLFRNHIGISPVEYRQIHRINRIKMYLQNENTTLDEITKNMEFCDSGYLCRFFKRETGMTPSEYRKLYFLQTKFLFAKSSADNKEKHG